MSDTQQQSAKDPAWEAYQQEVAAAGGGNIPELPPIDDGDKKPAAKKSTPTRGGATHSEKWKAHLDLLREYKERHGTTNVSRKENKELGRWVNNQREAYRFLLEGKQSGLTVERIDALEEVSYNITCTN